MHHKKISRILSAAAFAVLVFIASPAYATTTPDTTPPSTPQNPYAFAVSSSQINVSWATSTDDVGVTAYKVYRDGVERALSLTTSYVDTGLSPSTLYSYTVAARDEAGNVSPQSSSASATTVALPNIDKFQIGDRVYVTTNKLNVRKSAGSGSKNLGFHRMGDQGTVIGGPTTATGYVWWNVNYDTAPDGWSAQDWLEKVTVAQDTGSPVSTSGSNTETVNQLASMSTVLQSMQELLAGPSTPDSSVLASVAATLASVQSLVSGIAGGR